jgi:protein arginine N-methyltransferase 1
MYALHDYARMIADEQRVAAYVRALEASVRPGSVVVDIGTGTGFFAIVACRLGARRVYAIDTNPVIEVARELAEENRCADRIELIQDDALRVTLRERADVVVSDLRGPTPLAPAHLVVTQHARETFLAPGGVLIPREDRLRVAVVSSRKRYEQALGPAEAANTTMRAARARLANETHKDRTRSIQPSDLATPGATWAVLDYSHARCEPVRGKVEWTMDRETEGHGLVLWFETTLVDGVDFSTEPGLDAVYPQLFLPWPEATRLRRDDRVAIDLCGQAEGEPWGWNTTLADSNGAVRAAFKQSSFLGAVVKPQPPAQLESRGTS